MSFDVYKGILANRPVLQRHHVNCRDVVAAKLPIAGRNFRVLEVAKADGAAGRNRSLRGRAFQATRADIQEVAMIEVDVLRRMLRLHLKVAGALHGRYDTGQYASRCGGERARNL